jgi:acyl carrier protein
MGLDGVELVMAVEEKFGITISDEEAQNVLTVGDMKRLIRAKLEVVDTTSCMTQRAFHVIRKAAISEFGTPRRKLRPDARLEDVVPRTDRRLKWERFHAALGVAELPDLVRPHRITVALTGLVASTVVLGAWYGALHPAYFGTALLIGVTAGCLLGWASARVTIPRKTRFKPGYDRVRDLARFLVARYPQVLGQPRTKKWTEEEISCLVRDVIIEQLAVTEFDDNSRFVKDLHID